MSRLLVLDADQTRAGLDPGRVLTAVRAALTAISLDLVSAPARIAATTPHGLLGMMPAHVPGLGLAAKLISVFADPAAPGRSSHQGLVAVFDDTDGRPLALLNAEPLTAVRTAASATVAMQALARPDRARISVIGNGTQARAQLGILGKFEPDAAVTVAGRDPERARLAAAIHPSARVASIEQAVRSADVVFCCTGAREPLFPLDWLSPGAHVSSVGGSHGHELDASVIGAAALFAEWPGAAAAPPPAGAHELQGTPVDQVTLVGAVLDGRHPGRRSPDELTVYKSTGHAALDVAAAAVAYEWALSQGIGTWLEI